MSDRWTDIAGEVRLRVRRLVVVRGLAWVCVVGVGLLWLAGVSDWWFRWDAPWGRLVLLAGIVLAVGGVGWRAVLRPLLVTLTDVDVARLIECYHSQPESRLSSAAQFRSAGGDPSLGSVELQRSTIEKADRALAGFEPERLLATAPVRRAVLAAIVVTMIAATTAAFGPLSSWTAVGRIVMPFADISWPRTTHLRILSAELTPLGNEALRTTAGEPLTVYVENKLGSLPDDLTLDLRLEDDPEERQSLRTTLLRDRDGGAHEVGIVTLLAYRGPVRFRVWGGDDDGTAWRSVEVVPSPMVTEFSVSVTPPAYTGRDVQSFEGAGLIEGFVGSRVVISGKANKRLAAAALHRERNTPMPLPLTDGGLRFRADFVIEEPGTSWYWLELEDRHRLREPEPPRYELRGIADRPPVVYLEEPASDLTVTPTAAVPLKIVARDDLGLAELRLRHRDAGSSLDEAAATIPLLVSAERSIEEVLVTTWELSSLALTPGARLTYWVEGVDACDLQLTPSETSGQIGTSARRHLDVISESEKLREIALLQSGLLDTLDALRDRQAQARDVTAQLRIQAELAKQLRPEDMDLLKQTELEQRDIRRQVADEANGLISEVEGIQRELESNAIDVAESAARLTLLADHLGELDGRWMPVIEQALARARKSAGRLRGNVEAGGDPADDDAGSLERPGDASPVSEPALRELRDAEQAQASAADVLADAASLLGAWRQRFHLRSELDDMIASQKEVQQETKAVGRETVAQALTRLPAQQQADLARLSDRQRRLATRLEELLEQPDAEQSAGTAAAALQTANSSADDLSEVQQWLRRQGTAGAMHQAAESLKRNEIPAAVSSQESVLAALREFGERLQETPFGDPETLLAELRRTRKQVETLRKQQEGLAQSSQQALSLSADPLRQDQLQRLLKRQSQLADEAEEIARQLKRQQQRDTARTADRAARRMHDAQSALEQQQPEDVAINQQEALDDLDQLESELAAREQDAEGELAKQRMLQLANKLRELAEQQQSLSVATSDLDSRYTNHGSWSRSLRRELRDLSAQQQALHEQLDAEQSSLSDLPVVNAALESAGALMVRAAHLLDEQKTGAQTVSAQQESERRLLAVVEIILEQDTGDVGDDRAPAALPPEGDGGSPQQTPALHLTTQLKLLRRMQADLNLRTSAAASGGEDEDAQSAIDDSHESLEREQGRIAELTRTLLQQVIDTQMPGVDLGEEPKVAP